MYVCYVNVCKCGSFYAVAHIDSTDSSHSTLIVFSGYLQSGPSFPARWFWCVRANFSQLICWRLGRSAEWLHHGPSGKAFKNMTEWAECVTKTFFPCPVASSSISLRTHAISFAVNRPSSRPCRDGEDGHAVPHGVTALCLYGLRHQQHWPHPAPAHHPGVCLRHLLHSLRYSSSPTARLDWLQQPSESTAAWEDPPPWCYF